MAERGARLDFVLDEGLLITQGMMKGLAAPAALIGVAEKGYLLARADRRGPARPLVDAAAPAPPSARWPRPSLGWRPNPMPARLDGVGARACSTRSRQKWRGSTASLLSNLWLFGPLVRRQLEAAPATNAILRTTMAPTILEAGDKDNVLPGARPGDRQFPAAAGRQHRRHDRRVQRIAGPGITVAAQADAVEASPVSPTDTPAYRAIARTVRELFPGTIVAPGLMIGGTDARHMAAISDAVYRFSPVRAFPADLARFHGTDERISIANHAQLIHFYQRLLTNVAAPLLAAR